MCVCSLTRRERLGMQQIQRALVLLVLLLGSRGGFLGAAAFLVVQLASFGQEAGSSGFGGGLDHRHQARPLLFAAGVLLSYTKINIHTKSTESYSCTWINVKINQERNISAFKMTHYRKMSGVEKTRTCNSELKIHRCM